MPQATTDERAFVSPFNRPDYAGWGLHRLRWLWPHWHWPGWLWRRRFTGSNLALRNMEHFGACEASTRLGGSGSGSLAPEPQDQGRDWQQPESLWAVPEARSS